MPEKMSKNFTREEFACQGNGCCGHSSPISYELVDALQELRDIVGTSLTINSGFRCKVHNSKIGGASESIHCLGLAADVKTPSGMTDEKFYKLAEKVKAFRDGGMGIYNGRIHVDVRRSGKARWDNR